jgi:hypothetical protein
MATKELRDLRRNFRMAYTHYRSCVQELIKASERGQRPGDQVVATEDRSFNDFAAARQELLKTLLERSSAK